MRYGIFSDVHSNLEAFQEVLASLNRAAVDKYLFLGDIVGYGADPDKAVAVLKDLSAFCVAGNHDQAAAGQYDISLLNPLAQQAIFWTRPRLSREHIRFLQTMPIIFEGEDFAAVHGSLYEPENFHYLSSLASARFNFRFLKPKFKLCFIGHTHRREIYVIKANTVARAYGRYITIEPDARYIVSVGSVGQPRDGNIHSSCCIYDTEKSAIFFERVAYDVKTAAEKILSAGLPPFLAERLYKGH